MALFLTGSTGYIGAHVLANLLGGCGDRVNLLVRAKSEREAGERLWKALQLHMDFSRFREYLDSRVTIFRGDLTDWRLGLDAADYGRLVASTDSIIHCAASLNRRSEKSCMNVNLRGTLEVIHLAQRIGGGLRRFSFVSTVAVAGRRQDEVVAEDRSIEWDRSDWDPTRAQKNSANIWCANCCRTFRRLFSGRASCSAIRAMEPPRNSKWCARLCFSRACPCCRCGQNDRIDIMPVDYVAEAIVALHQKEKPAHDIYHLSSGTGSETCRQITDALAKAPGAQAAVHALAGEAV